MNRKKIVEYEKRVIFFIDILGTRSLVKRTIDDNELLIEIVTTLERMIDSFKRISSNYNDYDLKDYNPNGNPLDIKTSHFSDSFVVSFHIDEDNLFLGSSVIGSFLETLTSHFYKIGILLRGGVTYGDLIHTDKVLFGPAMIDAYELESKIAKYPRIIVSEKLLRALSAHITIEDENDRLFYGFIGQMYMSKDCDGYYYFDYINMSHLLRSPFLMIDNMFFVLDCLDNLKNPELKEKYVWLRNKILDYNEQMDLSRIAHAADAYNNRATDEGFPSITLPINVLDEYRSSIELLKKERESENE